jgi:hypothetical protein
MIDYVVLCAFSPFAAIMQLHPGWVSSIVNCMPSLLSPF